jgi:hypothetical protein
VQPQKLSTEKPVDQLTDGAALVYWLSNHVHDAAQRAATHWHLQQQQQQETSTASTAKMVRLPATRCDAPLQPMFV